VKKLAFGIILAGALLPASGRAQVSIDVTRITCADYLAMEPDEAKMLASWMSGWFHQKHGSTKVDLNIFAQNIANVRQWCQSNPKETILAGLTRAIEQK
jgi:hypothetical protein